MNSLKKKLYPLALLTLALTGPCMAASSTASSVSDSLGASVGSLSTSVEKSSHSSAKAVDLAEGDYAITEVVAAADRADTLRLTLHALTADGVEDFYLYVPAKTVAQAQLGQGSGVTLKQRSYGTEFAAMTNKQAFFLVVNDAVYRELPSQPVTL